MHYTIEGDNYALLKINLDGETVYAETGSVVLIDGTVEVSTTSYDGIVKGILRKIFAGESIFLLKLSGLGEVWLSPPLPGEIAAVHLKGDCFVVQDYAYLAHAGKLKFSFEHKGLKSLLSTELVWLKVCGEGTLWVSGYGHLRWIEVKPNQKLDPMHFVVFPECEYELEGITEGFKNNLLDGEADFIKFEKPTKVLIQSRIVPPLAQAVSRFTPQKAFKNLLFKRKPF
jgi:uncharacterized protein (TIGR00266 family)